MYYSRAVPTDIDIRYWSDISQTWILDDIRFYLKFPIMISQFCSSDTALCDLVTVVLTTNPNLLALTSIFCLSDIP